MSGTYRGCSLLAMLRIADAGARRSQHIAVWCVESLDIAGASQFDNEMMPQGVEQASLLVCYEDARQRRLEKDVQRDGKPTSNSSG